MRDAMRAVEILNRRARRRHDAHKWKSRLRAHERVQAQAHAHAHALQQPEAVPKRNRGPRISERRRTLDDVDVYRVDVAYEWALA
ncbi:MAG: hypothetical protein NVSMB21_23580 [Vulcanimicrobiaceae bacterium]